MQSVKLGATQVANPPRVQTMRPLAAAPHAQRASEPADTARPTQPVEPFMARMRAAYAKRAPVPMGARHWDRQLPGYNPPWIHVPKTAGHAAPTPGAPDSYVRYNGKPVRFDEATGLPLHPLGRQGVRGPGAVGGYGPRLAADAMVMTQHPTDGLCVLAIQRADNGLWALPGGKLDPLPTGGYEAPEIAMARELAEEAGVAIDASRFASGLDVYRGLIKGQRDTDNAWLETATRLVVVPWAEARGFVFACEPGGVLQAAWVPVAEAVRGEPGERRLVQAGHWRLVRRALRLSGMSPSASHRGR